MTQEAPKNVIKQIVIELVNILRKQDFLTYFRTLSLLSLEKDTIVFGVVSDFIRDNISTKFSKELLEATKKLLPEITIVELRIDAGIDTYNKEQAFECHSVLKEVAKIQKVESQTQSQVEGIQVRNMNEKYQMANFVVGPSNQLAFAACEAVIRRPGSAYNPLFIYGDVGLGKTHLLQATGNAIRERFKDKKVIYTTADRFLSDYVASVKNRTTDKLRERYRAIDVLIIDDIQFLAKKTQTQEELYNIFNIMYEGSKQIILSGDRAPRELTELEPRLKSRFEWGIIVDIGAPDFETRLAILQEKARAREFLISQEVSEYIAHNTGSNVREIEGILNQIIAEYELHGKIPNLENVSNRLSKLSITQSLIRPTSHFQKGPHISQLNYTDLLEVVAQHFGIQKDMLISDDRHKQNMIPRQVAMYLLKHKLSYTYERIGNIFSGRNHSAVLYSCKKLELLLKKDQKLSYEISVIRSKLGM